MGHRERPSASRQGGPDHRFTGDRPDGAMGVDREDEFPRGERKSAVWELVEGESALIERWDGSEIIDIRPVGKGIQFAPPRPPESTEGPHGLRSPGRWKIGKGPSAAWPRLACRSHPSLAPPTHRRPQNSARSLIQVRAVPERCEGSPHEGLILMIGSPIVGKLAISPILRNNTGSP
jgi:hypothetical protein